MVESSAGIAGCVISQSRLGGLQAVSSGGVDVVFNNAGYGLAGSLEGLSDEQIVRLVNTNVIENR